MDFKLVDGKFYEHNKVTVSIDGKIISRIVRYNTMDGLYIVYQNRKYFEYELDYCLDKERRWRK